MEDVKNDFDIAIIKKKDLDTLRFSDNMQNLNKKSDLSQTDLFKFLWIGIVIIFMIALIFLSYNGYFRSESSQNLEVIPNNTMTTNNEYKFTPNTENKYNMSFYPNYTINIYLDKDLVYTSE